jgi:hypothetical protein
MIRGFARWCWIAAIAGSLGCSESDLLEPDLPDVIDAGDLATAAGAPAVYAGAIAELVLAHDGASGLALLGGLFTDELMHASTPPAVREWDLRAVLPTNPVGIGTAAAPGPFLALHRARTALEAAVDRVKPFFPANDKRIGELWALAGMTYILAGEHFCSGAPFSERVPSFEFGPSLTTAEMFERSLERLTEAGSNTGGDPGVKALVAVLRGRALLDLGRYSEAAAAVAPVPTEYVYQFFHSAATVRQQNQLFVGNDNDVYSVADREGTNGLDFATAGDPRVEVQASTRTPSGKSRNDGLTPMYYLTGFTTPADPTTPVTGVEARLIEAEAALRAGDVDRWLGRLNLVRAQFPGLEPLTDPGADASRIELTFRERAFTLYLTGHRLGDLRRLVRQYGRPIEAVYPTAGYHKQGLTRGRQGSFPVPQTEQNNPVYDPADCKPNQA